MKTKLITLVIVLAILGAGYPIYAQTPLTLEQAIDVALKNNISLKASAFEVEAQRSLKRTSFDLPKTNVTLLYGQYNSYAKNDNNITVTQEIPLTAFGSNGKLMRAQIASRELKQAVTENELIYQVKQAYIQLVYTKSRQALLLQQDSIYEGFLKSANLRYKTGETNMLEQTTAEVQRNEVKNQLMKNDTDITVLRTQLKILLNSDTLPDAGSTLTALQYGKITDTLTPSTNPSFAYMQQQVEVAQSQKKVEVAKFAPDILVGVFSQSLIGVENTEDGSLASSSERFTGFQVGLAVPLWFAPHRARVKAAEFNRQAAESNFNYYTQSLEGQRQQAYHAYSVSRNTLTYYHTSALPNAELILKQSQAGFRGGEIGYAEYLMGLRNAISIKENYLTTLKDYNLSVIYMEYLSGNK